MIQGMYSGYVFYGTGFVVFYDTGYVFRDHGSHSAVLEAEGGQ